ncbi:hypothetical protein WU86_07810 [Corynebacterium xerosis]|nr:hypothetical protein WU86_07810 [Corynebacterium xerosis]
MTIWLSASEKTKPTLRRTSRPLRAGSRPPTSMRPDDASASPLIRRTNVDLPPPLGPMMPMRRSDSSTVTGPRARRPS